MYAVGQLSIGERARARENTRRGTRQRNRESASVREGTCTRVGEGERRSERQSEIFVLACAVQKNCKRAPLPGVHVRDPAKELDTTWLHARVASAC